jgi:hypothetical protein
LRRRIGPSHHENTFILQNLLLFALFFSAVSPLRDSQRVLRVFHIALGYQGEVFLEDLSAVGGLLFGWVEDAVLELELQELLVAQEGGG